MTRKSRRLWLLVACGVGLGSASALALDAFSANIVFFVAPSQLLASPATGRTVRLGGMVVAGSLREEHRDGEPVARFLVTDGQQAVAVRYAGILPDLFREGQSVVALGALGSDGSFSASEVLAKHDETYMPKEVAEALRRSGKWDPRFGPAPSAASWNRMSVKTDPTRGS
nr:cytochrome c maturation protein CcmE [uncultured Lichenicoccus sp.]